MRRGSVQPTDNAAFDLTLGGWMAGAVKPACDFGFSLTGGVDAGMSVISEDGASYGYLQTGFFYEPCE